MDLFFGIFQQKENTLRRNHRNSTNIKKEKVQGFIFENKYFFKSNLNKNKKKRDARKAN